MIFHGLPRLPRPGEELRTRGFTRTVGGGTVISGIAAARLGARVEIVSALADDAVGRIRAAGACVRNMRRVGESHAVSVALSTRRDRAFVTCEGVNESLEPRVLEWCSRRVPRARHLHVAMGPRDLRSWTDVLTRLRAGGVGTSWDFGWHEALPARPGFHELLGALDWVFVNEQEARHYAGASTMARALVRWRSLARATVVKQGVRGALVVTQASVIRVAAPKVQVVDTTGAGDAFNGGFLAALVMGRTVTECLRLGVAVGTLSTRSAGGLESLPTESDAETLVGRLAVLDGEDP